MTAQPGAHTRRARAAAAAAAAAEGNDNPERAAPPLLRPLLTFAEIEPRSAVCPMATPKRPADRFARRHARSLPLAGVSAVLVPTTAPPAPPRRAAALDGASRRPRHRSRHAAPRASNPARARAPRARMNHKIGTDDAPARDSDNLGCGTEHAGAAAAAPPPPPRAAAAAAAAPPPPPPPPHREADVTSRMYYPTPRPKIGESHAGSIDRPDSRCAHAAAAPRSPACAARRPPPRARASAGPQGRASFRLESRRAPVNGRPNAERSGAAPPARCPRLPPPSTLHLPTRDVSRHVWGKPRCDTHAWRCHRRALPHGARVFLYATDTTTRRARARGSACGPPALTAGSLACAQARRRRLRPGPVVTARGGRRLIARDRS